jgi:hypothetical protein
MKCKICHEDPSGISCQCLCGYCKKCLDRYGHDKCWEIEKSGIKRMLGKKDAGAGDKR